MKVLLTGSTGFVGRHVLPALAARHEVVALVRRAQGPAPAGAAWAEGDLETLDPAVLPDPLRR